MIKEIVAIVKMLADAVMSVKSRRGFWRALTIKMHKKGR